VSFFRTWSNMCLVLSTNNNSIACFIWHVKYGFYVQLTYLLYSRAFWHVFLGSSVMGILLWQCSVVIGSVRQTVRWDELFYVRLFLFAATCYTLALKINHRRQNIIKSTAPIRITCVYVECFLSSCQHSIFYAV